jgi:ATP-dependent Clp protease, protease subunit
MRAVFAKIPEPVSEGVHVDAASRSVYLEGEVTREMARGLEVALGILPGPGEVRIWANSPGGDEDGGFAMLDTLALCGKRTVFEGYGDVSSIMVAVMQGATVRRLAPNAVVLVHNGTMSMGSKAPDYDKAEMLVRRAEKRNRQYYEVLSARSAMSVDQVEMACRQEALMTAAEAVAVGLADELLEPKRKERPGR